jgi:hypothetical protein
MIYRFYQTSKNVPKAGVEDDHLKTALNLRCYIVSQGSVNTGPVDVEEVA